jgi:carbohydrate-selective porin OprB
MMRSACLAALAAAALSCGAAHAQQAQTNASGGSGGIGALLADGYEIKAAFVNANTSYVFLQKEKSAYMCSSQRGSACEKLN